MPITSTRMWRQIETALGRSLRISDKKRWSKRWPEQLDLLWGYIDGFLTEHPNEKGHRDAIWTCMKWISEKQRRPALASLSSEPGEVEITDPVWMTPKDRGCLYAVQVGDSGPIKIGFSRRPSTRIRSLQTASPYRLRSLGGWGGTVADERALHESFAEHRMSGEWFRPHPALLQEIKRLTIPYSPPESPRIPLNYTPTGR